MGYIIYKYGILTFCCTIVFKVTILMLSSFEFGKKKKNEEKEISLFFFFFACNNKNNSLQSLHYKQEFRFHCQILAGEFIYNRVAREKVPLLNQVRCVLSLSLSLLGVRIERDRVKRTLYNRLQRIISLKKRKKKEKDLAGLFLLVHLPLGWLHSGQIGAWWVESLAYWFRLRWKWVCDVPCIFGAAEKENGCSCNRSFRSHRHTREHKSDRFALMCEHSSLNF